MRALIQYNSKIIIKVQNKSGVMTWLKEHISQKRKEEKENMDLEKE